MNQLVWLIRGFKQSFYFAIGSNGNRYGLTIQYYHILWYEYLYNMYICTICIYISHITCSFIEIMLVLSLYAQFSYTYIWCIHICTCLHIFGPTITTWPGLTPNVRLLRKVFQIKFQFGLVNYCLSIVAYQTELILYMIILLYIMRSFSLRVIV